MPLTFREYRDSSREELLQKYTRDEIRDFARSQLQMMQSLQAPAEETRSGITPYDPSQDFFSTQNLGAMAGNIPASAYHMAGDVAEAAWSPIETGKAAWETGAGGLLEGLGRRFGVTYDENEGLGYDPELLKKTLVEDPTGMFLDVVPGMQGIGAGAKAARLGTRAVSAAQKIGPTATRVAEKAVQAADSPLLRAATSPVRAMAQTVRGVGSGAGGIARAASSAISGIDPGVLSTAREVLGEYGRKGTEAGDFAREGRKAFEAARKTPDAVPEAVVRIEAGIASHLDELGSGMARSAVGSQRPTAQNLVKFQKNIAQSLKNFDVRPYRNAAGELEFDFSKSSIPEEFAAQRRIKKAMRAILGGYEGGTLEDLWRARKQLDEANSTALKQKFGNTEIGILKVFRAKTKQLLDSVDNPEFQRLNKAYEEGSALRTRFDKLAGTRVDPEGQISSVIRAIRESRQSSNEFLKKVERQTGTPLRAIAAGAELQGLLPRGLVGRGVFANVAALTFGSEVLLAFFLAPPAALRTYLKAIGATERKIKVLGAVTDQIMGLPRATALAEQGLTIGAIIQQLSDQPEQPSFLGQFAPR